MTGDNKRTNKKCFYKVPRSQETKPFQGVTWFITGGIMPPDTGYKLFN